MISPLTSPLKMYFEILFSNEKLRIKNGNKIFIGNLNINSLPNSLIN